MPPAEPEKSPGKLPTPGERLLRFLPWGPVNIGLAATCWLRWVEGIARAIDRGNREVLLEALLAPEGFLWVFWVWAVFVLWRAANLPEGGPNAD